MASPVTPSRQQALETLARLGYAVKGVVYGLVGVLAVQAAFGSGGQTTGSRGAIDTLAGGPFGRVLLWIVGIGLAGYTLWRFAQSILNVEHYDDEGAVVYINHDLDGRETAITVAHELGHAFGLYHVRKEERTSVMNHGNLVHEPNDSDVDALEDVWGACSDS